MPGTRRPTTIIGFAIRALATLRKNFSGMKLPHLMRRIGEAWGVNGDVRVTLFEGDFYHAEEYSSEALFCRRLSSLSMAKADGNDTSFAWLPVAWMKFPDHLHILLTDGEGELPLLIPERDRKRTCAIVIPDGRPDLITPVADRVVVVQDLARLPGVFAFLAPRGWIA